MPQPSEQGATHELQTPLGADQLRHQVPQPQQLLVLLRTMRQRDLYNTKGEASMTKEEALAAIKLLSALESWAFSQQSRLPDYLVEDIQRSMEVLERVVLEKNT
jgi:hypothetical protein